MRRGATFFIIALAVAALLHGRRKPIEDAGDDSAHGDCFPHSLSGAWGLPLPRADAGRGARTCAPVPSPDIEDDGFLTVFPVHGAHNRTGGQQDHA